MGKKANMIASGIFLLIAFLSSILDGDVNFTVLMGIYAIMLQNFALHLKKKRRIEMEQTCFDGRPCDRPDGDCNKCKWMNPQNVGDGADGDWSEND